MLVRESRLKQAFKQRNHEQLAHRWHASLRRRTPFRAQPYTRFRYFRSSTVADVRKALRMICQSSPRARADPSQRVRGRNKRIRLVEQIGISAPQVSSGNTNFTFLSKKKCFHNVLAPNISLPISHCHPIPSNNLSLSVGPSDTWRGGGSCVLGYHLLAREEFFRLKPKDKSKQITIPPGKADSNCCAIFSLNNV